MLAGAGRFDGRVQRQQVGLAGDLLDDGDLAGDLLHRRHRFRPPHLPLSWASLADLVAILSVCWALSAFCLMLETISSIEEEASSAEAACALAPFETCTEAVLIDWLAEADFAGNIADFAHRAGQAVHHGRQGLHELVLRTTVPG